MFLCKAAAILGAKPKFCHQPHHKDSGLNQRFQAHMSEHGLNFATSEEYAFRLAIFAGKDQLINQHNMKDSSFKLGHNKFSTWSDEEYKQLLGAKIKEDKNMKYKKLDTRDLNDSVDWRAQGAVNPVKDQGRCGSCWAFSATGAIESAHAIQSGELLSLSDQQTTSCALGFGCGGGWQWAGFLYAESSALELDSDYPYTSGTSQQTGDCSPDESKGKVNVASYTAVPANSVADLKAAIAQ